MAPISRITLHFIRATCWREYRQITQAELAEKSVMAQATIAQMESAKRVGSVTALKKIRWALNLDLDDWV
ncbi:MAG: helix-turn-helix domain-containing protein [Methylobacter sp.]